MKLLERPEKAGLLLSFDFDGTLYHPASRPPVAERWFEVIESLRSRRGALWGINTGRSIGHVVEGLVDGRFPFSPDWVVAREREIWLPNAKGGWVEHGEWNRRVVEDQEKFFREVEGTLVAIRKEVEEHTGATWIEQPGDPAGLVARTEEEMAWIMTVVERLAAEVPLLGWQRNSIWLRFGHRNYQKGSSLKEVGRLFGLGADSIFAIGDSHNDFEMLDPGVAGYVACPANAVVEVRRHVERVGGMVCKKSHSEGCVEALEVFFGGGEG